MTGRSVTERLRSVDVCAVSDALDRLGLPGAVAGILPVWEGGRTAGRIVTMSIGSANGRSAARHLGTAAIEKSQEDEVIVIERRDVNPERASAWGGLLARATVQRGIAGVIIDGACRDLDEIRELGLCVFARGAVPFTARGRVIEESVGEEITIAGVRIATGDYVIADGSGLAFVASANIDEVLKAAEDIAAREALMASDIEKGQSPSTVMGKAYEELLHG